MEISDRSLGNELPSQTDSPPTAAPTVINVSEVPPATKALPELPYKAAVESLLAQKPARLPEEVSQAARQQPTPVEACSCYHGHLVAGVRFHPVVAAVHWAFNDHRPLVLSPDVVWLLVAQGFANHVNAQAEELRPQLVKHLGKLSITVRRDDFIKGSPENPWPEVFDEFSLQIRQHIGEATHDLLLPTFSTTGATEKAAAQVVLLDALQSYFSYEVISWCGIPQVVLEGAADDWELLAERTQDLGRFGLGWWTETLVPILGEFAAAAWGCQSNRLFWQSIYKLNDASGGPYVTGWMTALFPYLKDWQTGQVTNRNPWLAGGGKVWQDLADPPPNRDRSHFFPGPTIDAFPAGLARAPFLWSYLGHPYEMEFLGGFVGVRQEAATLRLKPEVGWAVREVVTV